MNVCTSPEAKEHTENARVDRINSPLREPVQSDSTPTLNAAIDHVRDNAPESIPTCVFVIPKSGWMKGIRKPDAFRSNSTNPKFRLSSTVSTI